MSKRTKIKAGDNVKFIGKMIDYPYPIEEVTTGEKGVVVDVKKDKDGVPCATVYFKKHDVQPTLWQEDLKLI